ncbi:MAG: efflux RND transporter periplasmic adaptor subunit [Deltaproteobacteria bacterium]|nr:efflux RND transporter periplasmic adaptor subunit [Deltaproteobacteria bacterium]
MGRIEPRGGVVRVSGPSRPSVVISKLRVKEGERVEVGQVIAVLDTHEVQAAEVTRLRAEVRNSERDYQRQRTLRDRGALSAAGLESWLLKRDVARANLQRARAELEQSSVVSPVSGRVLDVHTRNGERVGPEGIVEIGETSAMYAIAEVYETDIGRVKIGQRATIRSPALAGPLEGTVERIGLKIGKKDILSSDPVAATDARVVEVEIVLDASAPVAMLTNLTVEVEIQP